MLQNFIICVNAVIPSAIYLVIGIILKLSGSVTDEQVRKFTHLVFITLYPFIMFDNLYGKDIAGKECAVITCCEEEDISVMDGVRVPLERTAALINWKMVGEVLVPGVLEAGTIEKTDGCAQAAALADKF